MNPVSGKSCSPIKGGLLCYICDLSTSSTTELEICISIYSTQLQDYEPCHEKPVLMGSDHALHISFCITITITCPFNVYPPYTPFYMSHRMGKPTICICENKGADQLRSNCEADQRLCFRYTDRTDHLLSKSKISSL